MKKPTPVEADAGSGTIRFLDSALAPPAEGNQADENEINEQDRQCPGDFFLKQAYDRIKNEKQNARDQNRKKQSGDKTEKRRKNKRDFR